MVAGLLNELGERDWELVGGDFDSFSHRKFWLKRLRLEMP